MTESEALLEEIFNSKKISFTKIPETNEHKTPDYFVNHQSETSYWEVKELEENPHEKKILHDISNDDNDVYQINSKRISSSIKSASKQFKGYGVEDKPCIIVLYDSRDFAVMDFLFMQHIQTAMLGSAEYMTQRDGSIREVRRYKGLLTENKQYISAVAVIAKGGRNMVILHNPNANIPIFGSGVSNLFDSHYQAVEDSIGLKWVKV